MKRQRTYFKRGWNGTKAARFVCFLFVFVVRVLLCSFMHLFSELEGRETILKYDNLAYLCFIHFH